MVPGMEKPLFFLDHDFKEAGQEDGASKRNETEAEMAIHLATYLMKQHDFGPGTSFSQTKNWVYWIIEDITILTPYIGQLQSIKRKMEGISIALKMSDKDEELLTSVIESGNSRSLWISVREVIY